MEKGLNADGTLVRSRYEKPGREAGFYLNARGGSAGRIRTYDQPVNSRLLYH